MSIPGLFIHSNSRSATNSWILLHPLLNLEMVFLKDSSESYGFDPPFSTLWIAVMHASTLYAQLVFFKTKDLLL